MAVYFSELAIGVYPTFLYNSSGGGGLGRATTVGNRVNIEVTPSTHSLYVCLLESSMSWMSIDKSIAAPAVA